VPEKFKEKAKSTFESFYENMPSKKNFFAFFLLNIANWMLMYFATFITGLAVGIELPFIYYLAILPIGTLVSLLPISINGLGTREATLVSLFGLFGVASEKVISMSLINIVIIFIIPSIIGSCLTLKKEE